MANKKPAGKTKSCPLALQDSMEEWFSEHPCRGAGDLRDGVAVEALYRQEAKSHWTVMGRKLSRVEVMELLVDMIAERHSMLDLLSMNGMPKAMTVSRWRAESAPFREAMDMAEKMRAMLLTDEAVSILEGTNPKRAYQDIARANLRMKLAEKLDPKKYGKKLAIENQDDSLNLDAKETWSKFRSILVVHAELIQQHTGVKIEVPVEEATVVDVVEEVPANPLPHELGIQGSRELKEVENA